MPAATKTRAEHLAELNSRLAASGKVTFKEREFRHAADPAKKPPKPPTNGGPQTFASPLEEFIDIGKSLYPGEKWIPRLAADIGEHTRQVRRWVNGEAEISERGLAQARKAMLEDFERRRRNCVRIGVIDP